MLDKVENFTGEVQSSSSASSRELLARSNYENAAIIHILSAQSCCCMAIRSCASLIVEKLAEQSCNYCSAVGRFIPEEEKQSMQCSSKDEPCLSARLARAATNLHPSEDYSPDNCNVRDDDRFLQVPDTNVIMSGNEINAWIAGAKNKDDDEEDDDDDDDDEEDNDDDAEEGSGEEGEGEEEVEGEEAGEDEEGGEEDDDEGEEGEEGGEGEEGEEEVGDEEEDEDGVEEEEVGGGDDDDGYDEEEGEDDEDEDDEDDEDKDETSEPPKKKRKD